MIKRIRLSSRYFIAILFSFLFTQFSCIEPKGQADKSLAIDSTENQVGVVKKVGVGAESLGLYLPKLKNKQVALVVNHSSRVGNQHLIDTLLALEIDVTKIFTPEHGFTGKEDAGAIIEDSATDDIPIISLYGKKRKPTPEDMKDIDIVIFDMQDVGVRFYTYISTMHYAMEACAEVGTPIIVLDRPNPISHYVDGPMLDMDYTSFVGMHPIPVAYGMTMGELATMINGEAWLKDANKCDLTVIKNTNYTHNTPYECPVPPSPNLPDQLSIYLYPSLCYFEGTPISIGRGTDRPFTKVGHPDYTEFEYSFVPMPNQGASKPKLEGKKCYGYDLGSISEENLRAAAKIDLKWVVEFHSKWKDDAPFFIRNAASFDRLTGSDQMRKQIVSGMSAEEIRESWQPELKAFKELRKNYLLYPDFE